MANYQQAVVPAPGTKQYTMQKRMALKMAADKKKVMGIKVGTYAYAVVDGEVLKFKIVSIGESRDITKPCYISYREVKTGRLDTVWMRLSNLKLTREEAQKELVAKLYEATESPREKLRWEQNRFDLVNKKYLKAQAALNKMTKSIKK